MTKRAKDEETGLSVMDTEDFRRRFPDGRMFSNPGLATPEHGRRLLEAAVRDATLALGKFLSGQDLVEEAEAAAKRAATAAAAEGAPLKERPRWGKGDAGRRARSARRGKENREDSNSSGGGVAGGVAGGFAEIVPAAAAAVVVGGGRDSKAVAEQGKALGRIPGEGGGERRTTRPSRNRR